MRGILHLALYLLSASTSSCNSQKVASGYGAAAS